MSFPAKVAGISGAYLTSTNNAAFSFFIPVVKHIPVQSLKMQKVITDVAKYFTWQEPLMLRPLVPLYYALIAFSHSKLSSPLPENHFTSSAQILQG